MWIHPTVVYSWALNWIEHRNVSLFKIVASLCGCRRLPRPVALATSFRNAAFVEFTANGGNHARWTNAVDAPSSCVDTLDQGVQPVLLVVAEQVPGLPSRASHELCVPRRPSGETAASKCLMP